MKLRTIYISVLALSMVVAGCRQDEIVDTHSDNFTLKINPYIKAQTKNSRIIEQNGNYSFCKGDSLAIVIYPDTSIPNPYDDGYIQTVSFDGANWNADFSLKVVSQVFEWTKIDKLTWPYFGTNFIVYAYTPDVRQNVMWSSYRGDVKLNQNIEESFYASDFMYGRTTTPKTNNPISIPLEHKLSMLTVEFVKSKGELNSIGMEVTAYTGYGASIANDNVYCVNDEKRVINAYKKDDNIFSVILPAQNISGDQILLSLNDGSKRFLKFELEMKPGFNHILKVDCSNNELFELETIEDIPWDDSVQINGGEYIESKVYKTGEVIVYQKNRTENPVTMVVTGDGYTKEDLLEGGNFERQAKEALDFLFDVEPYKTYRDYFNVYIIPALSGEKGADNYSNGVRKNTYFDSGWSDDYSDMGANETTVMNFLETYCPDIVEGKVGLDDVPICLLINDSRYGGICYSWASGKSYAIVPVTDGEWKFYGDEELGISVCDWRNTFLHEYGGHSFGRLLDEYYDEGSDRTYYGNSINAHNWSVPMGLNVTADTTGVNDLVYWKNMIDDERFPKVGFFEGGYTYEKGIWRSEAISAMYDNRRYFNAISRKIIVESIMKKANETFDFDDFCSKDVDYDELRDSKSRTINNLWGIPEYKRTPPPVLME